MASDFGPYNDPDPIVEIGKCRGDKHGRKVVPAGRKVTANERVSGEEVPSLLGRFEPRTCRSRRRVGRCEFLARLFRYPF